MVISSKGRYALRVMVDLAEHGGDGYVSMRDVARRQEISDKYAGQIMTLLSRAGLVDGVTGKGGGYRLTRRPEEYPLGEILRLTEGSLAPVACLEEGAHPCDRAARCRTLPVWNRLGQLIGDYLDSVTLRDLKSFYASVECVARELDPLTTNLVVADKERTDKTICLAVTPSLKAYGISGRARLFEVVQRVEEINRYRRSKAPGRKLDGESYDDPELKRNPSLALSYIVAPPRMSYYMETSARIYDVYLKFIAPEDIHVYSIDEVFIDLTPYLKTYQKTPREMAEMLIKEVLTTTGITATAGIGTNMYLAKVAMDITAKKMPADENGVRIAELDEMSYRRELWTHRPLTDFWMVGRGISKKLEDNYMFTMGDVARCSQYNEAKVGTEITEGENELWL